MHIKMLTKHVGTTHVLTQRSQHYSQTTNIILYKQRQSRICFRYIEATILIHGRAIVWMEILYIYMYICRH